jgi:hypothetical protein
MAPADPPHVIARKRKLTQEKTTSKTNSKRPATKTSAQAASATAKRRSEAQQASLVFQAKDKYPVGLKLLLNESIYPSPSQVSKHVVCCL